MSKIAMVPVIAICVLAGCGKNTRPVPPQPPSIVNASLALPAGFINSDVPLTGDTIIVASMRKHFDLNDRITGNWHHYWYIEQGDVLRVEKGIWPNANILFMTEDDWPTPGSGILVNKAPWPYMVGTVWAFGLDTTVKPARIISQEIRSYVQPHERPLHIVNAGPAVQSKISDAVGDYLKKNNIHMPYVSTLEELDVTGSSGRYAVHIWNQEMCKILIVDIPTMSVSEYKEPSYKKPSPHTK